MQVETVARGLEHPRALEFLPDGRILVTERPGRLRIVARDGRLSKALYGVPRVFARGQVLGSILVPFVGQYGQWVEFDALFGQFFCFIG